MQVADNPFVELLEGAPDAMVCVDRCGRIALVTAQTERLFGRTFPTEISLPAIEPAKGVLDTQGIVEVGVNLIQKPFSEAQLATLGQIITQRHATLSTLGDKASTLAVTYGAASKVMVRAIRWHTHRRCPSGGGEASRRGDVSQYPQITLGSLVSEAGDLGFSCL